MLGQTIVEHSSEIQEKGKWEETMGRFRWEWQGGHGCRAL